VKNVRIKVSDETYRRLSQEAKAAGYPGIASYILSKTDVTRFDHDAQTEALALNSQAMHLALLQEANKPFTMQDLFTEKDWKHFTKAARIRAGVIFKQSVEDGPLKGIVVLGEKTGSHHQQYIRVENNNG
jgi:hypothetical protein